MLRAFSSTLSFIAKDKSINNSFRLLSTTKRLLVLNNLAPNPGSRRTKHRFGRGTGSGRGKLCGRGHQFSRSTPWGFEGGQTPLHRRFPKVGFTNVNRKEYKEVSLEEVQTFITQGRLTPKENGLLTMRDLVSCGLINNVHDGVKLLRGKHDTFATKIHFEVARASKQAIQAVEKLGGTVTCTYFTPLSLRALIKPWKFDLLPMRARPPPKVMQWYLDKDNCGYLSPEIQKRNLKLFGYVTSEKEYRQEHELVLAAKRKQWDKEREQRTKEIEKKMAARLEKIKAKHQRKYGKLPSEEPLQQQQ